MTTGAARTTGEMAEYLARYGWERAPRKHGDRAEWRDPLDGCLLIVEDAYEVAREREEDARWPT